MIKITDLKMKNKHMLLQKTEVETDIHLPNMAREVKRHEFGVIVNAIDSRLIGKTALYNAYLATEVIIGSEVYIQVYDDTIIGIIGDEEELKGEVFWSKEGHPQITVCCETCMANTGPEKEGTHEEL